MMSFGFPPISSPSARVLILGSLPGRLSLKRGEYYANPQNAFWKIIAARAPDLPSDYAGRVQALVEQRVAQNAFWKIIAARAPDLPSDYAGRVQALVEQRVALWDVLAAATRSGSLDADIADDAIPNNFRAFLHAHPEIRFIGFNGGTAGKLYERHVLLTLTDAQRAISRTTLPSTSPAHAGLSFAEKATRWSVVFGD